MYRKNTLEIYKHFKVEFCLYMSVYHVCSALRGQKEAINVLELELQCDQQHDAKN